MSHLSPPTIRPRHARLRHGLVTSAAAAAVAVAMPPGAHAASIWTQVDSGTTASITSVKYRPGKLVYATDLGKVLLKPDGAAAAVVSDFGTRITDLDFTPDGTKGLALLSDGRVSRSADGGATWSAPLQLKTYNFGQCNGVAAPAVGLTNVTSALSLRWANSQVAYVVGSSTISGEAGGSVLRTTDAGATWSEVSRRANQTCQLSTLGKIQQVAPVVTPGTPAMPGKEHVYFMYGGTLAYTGDGLTTPATERPWYLPVTTKTIAVDPANENRIASDAYGSPAFTADGGLSEAGTTVTSVVGGPTPLEALSVEIAGGVAFWVGKEASVYTSTDGRTAYSQRADGVPTSVDWNSISSYDGIHAAIAGTGGNLYVTGAANTIPTASTGTTGGTTGGTAPAPVPTPAPTGGPNPGDFTTAPITPKGTFTDKFTGGEISVQGPKQCVKAGSPFSVTVKMRKLQIRKNRIVKLSSVTFYVDDKKVKTLKKAPFKQTLTVAGGLPGSKHVVKAVGKVKVKSGKAPKRTLKLVFQICA